jgi:hypothetical protein
VDAILCDVQGSAEEAKVERFRPLPVRMGVAGSCRMNIGGDSFSGSEINGQKTGWRLWQK